MAIGIILLPHNPWVAWAGIVFFGLGDIVFVIQVIRPSLLVLDADGFQSRVLFRRSGYKRKWVDCSVFTPTSMGATKLVTYSTATGGNEAVQTGYGGLSADQLADLMNRYRDEKRTSRPAGIQHLEGETGPASP